jgi:hypothetical protein
MTNTTIVEPKPNLFQRGAAKLKQHERKILIATTVTSTVIAIAQHSGIKQHNAFLKEKGLFDEFYGIESAIEA